MDEIEIRGKINKEGFQKLEKFLNKNAKLIDEYNRLTVDSSPGFDPKTRNWDQINKKLNNKQIDLRIKKSGQTEKIVVKVGYYSSKNRQEFEVDIKEGQFVNALMLCEALGFKANMIYRWKSRIYEYKDFEIKINEYPKSYYDWEIESLNPESDPDELAKELSLHPFSDEEFREAINWKNRNLNELYSPEKVSETLKKWG
jgi:hypothetical protein